MTLTETANGEEVLIRKGFIYRSGMLSFITDEGNAEIVSELGTRTISICGLLVSGLRCESCF